MENHFAVLSVQFAEEYILTEGNGTSDIDFNIIGFLAQGLTIDLVLVSVNTMTATCKDFLDRRRTCSNISN